MAEGTLERSSPEQLHLWRQERLLELGVPELEASALAVARNFDWHEAERLIRKGCPPELVFKILT